MVITIAQDLSHKLKVDESADLTESEPWIVSVLSRDRTTTHAISFEEECG